MPTFFRSSAMWLGAVLLISLASPAAAKDWTRTTPRGGEVSRDLTNQGGGHYSGTTSRTGANGGTYSSSSSCVNGFVATCSRSYSGAGPNGKSFSGDRKSAYGPYRARSVGRFTGPNGNTVYGVRRFRR